MVKGNKKKVGIKNDSGKRDWSLLQLHWLEGVVDVLMLGAEEYTRDNWQVVEGAERRYASALFRHLADHFEGSHYDSQSGELHIDHAICNLLFLRWFLKQEEDKNK